MTYDSTRGNASLRHEINNSLTLISSRLQLLAARYVFLKEDSDFTEIQNDLSDIQRLLKLRPDCTSAPTDTMQSAASA